MALIRSEIRQLINGQPTSNIIDHWREGSGILPIAAVQEVNDFMVDEFVPLLNDIQTDAVLNVGVYTYAVQTGLSVTTPMLGGGTRSVGAAAQNVKSLCFSMKIYVGESVNPLTGDPLVDQSRAIRGGRRYWAGVADGDVSGGVFDPAPTAAAASDMFNKLLEEIPSASGANWDFVVWGFALAADPPLPARIECVAPVAGMQFTRVSNLKTRQSIF